MLWARKLENFWFRVSKTVLYTYVISTFFFFLMLGSMIGGTGGLFVFFIIFLPSALLVSSFAYFVAKYGREPKMPAQNFIYMREVPYGYGPAVAAALVDWGVQENDITATFLDLVRRKFFRMDEARKEDTVVEERDYMVTNLRKPTKGLRPYELAIYDLIIENMEGGKMYMREFRDRVSGSKAYEDFLQTWERSVEDELEGLSLVDYTGVKNFRKAAKTIFILGVIFALLTGTAFLFSLFILLLMPGILYLGLASASKKYLARRTPLGIEHCVKWAGLKKYLADFGSMRGKMPKELALWDRYLVFATAFGVAEGVSGRMDLILPEKSKLTSPLYVATHTPESKSRLVEAFHK